MIKIYAFLFLILSGVSPILALDNLPQDTLYNIFAFFDPRPLKYQDSPGRYDRYINMTDRLDFEDISHLAQTSTKLRKAALNYCYKYLRVGYHRSRDKQFVKRLGELDNTVQEIFLDLNTVLSFEDLTDNESSLRLMTSFLYNLISYSYYSLKDTLTCKTFSEQSNYLRKQLFQKIKGIPIFPYLFSHHFISVKNEIHSLSRMPITSLEQLLSQNVQSLGSVHLSKP